MEPVVQDRRESHNRVQHCASGTDRSTSSEWPSTSLPFPMTSQGGRLQRWLAANARTFGFSLSYPKGLTEYHALRVGELALSLHRKTSSPP